jgi:hypothetical protein
MHPVANSNSAVEVAKRGSFSSRLHQTCPKFSLRSLTLHPNSGVCTKCNISRYKSTRAIELVFQIRPVFNSSACLIGILRNPCSGRLSKAVDWFDKTPKGPVESEEKRFWESMWTAEELPLLSSQGLVIFSVHSSLHKILLKGKSSPIDFCGDWQNKMHPLLLLQTSYESQVNADSLLCLSNTNINPLGILIITVVWTIGRTRRWSGHVD